MNEPEGGSFTCTSCKAARKVYPSYGAHKDRQRRRDALLCTECGLVTVATISTRCEACKEVERLKSNTRYAALRAAGTCIRCCRRRATKRSIRCRVCKLERTLEAKWDATDRAEWQEPPELADA